MKCPICASPVEINGKYMPFCGERCKTVDLGNWASGKYVISTPLTPEDLLETVRDAAEEA